MARVHVVSSLAVCVFLLLTSLSAAREARPAQRAWAPLTEEQQKTFNYLALFKCEPNIMCSGSILSETLVMTNCANVATDCAVYAGKVDIPTAKTTNGDMQTRQVKTVVKDEESDLSICVMNSNWKFNDFVDAITLNDQSVKPTKTCQVLGFRAAGSKIVPHILKDQAIDDGTQCSVKTPSPNYLYSKTAEVNEKLAGPDRGGPMVCDNVQWGINIECKKEGTGDGDPECNKYVNVTHYRQWIEDQKNKLESAESEESGGANGNGTSPSSGYTIHSYLNKYSNWKMLLLCFIIIKFLVY